MSTRPIVINYCTKIAFLPRTAKNKANYFYTGGNAACRNAHCAVIRSPARPACQGPEPRCPVPQGSMATTVPPQPHAPGQLSHGRGGKRQLGLRQGDGQVADGCGGRYHLFTISREGRNTGRPILPYGPFYVAKRPIRRCTAGRMATRQETWPQQTDGQHDGQPDGAAWQR